MAKHLTTQELRALNKDTWFIRTYCTKKQIEDILEMDDRIEWWRGITHDKDTKEDGTPKERHEHIIIKYKERIKGSTVYNLFKGEKDEKGKEINSEIQVCNSKSGSYKYLTHNTEKAKREGKYLYDEEDIYGEGEIDLTEEGNNIYVQMIQKIKDKTAPIQMVYEYGMLYIANIKNLKIIINEQIAWEKNSMDKE